MIRLRGALAVEAAALSTLCYRSKAVWGYDEAFMALSRTSLEVKPAQIEAGDVWVAEIDGGVAGVVSLAAMDEPHTIELDSLFVDPAHLRSGVGHALLHFAIEEARRRGMERMSILADPNAAGFYERFGATYLRQASSDAIPGRLMPLFELRL